MITSPKRILTLFWSPVSFPIIEILPKEDYCDIEFFCSKFLQKIDRIRPADTAEVARTIDLGVISGSGQFERAKMRRSWRK
jgi:hypothetical protein